MIPLSYPTANELYILSPVFKIKSQFNFFNSCMTGFVSF